MQKITRLLSATVLLLILLSVVVTAAGDSGYSMSADPLASKSYVDSIKAEVIRELAGGIDKAALEEYLQSSTYEVMALKKNQTIAASGSCEMILRAGTGTVIISSSENISAGVGFSDLTGGSELRNGAAVPRNHLLLASAGDGRMIEVTSDTAYFMVRGDYTVVG